MTIKDPECCDGSDENSGIIKCPNICEQVANEQNKEEMERKKILKEVYIDNNGLPLLIEILKYIIKNIYIY